MATTIKSNVVLWQVIDHGEDGSQYFPGCGTAYTDFDHVSTGVGDTAREALEDALEMASQDESEPEFSDAQKAEMLARLSNPDKDCHAKCGDDCHSEDEEHDWHHYISVRYNLATYERLREKVMDSDDCDLFAAREVAYAWHGGQGSALYSFASTDATVWSEEHRALLISEVEVAIKSVQAKPLDFYATWEDVDQYTREQCQSGTPAADWCTPAEAGEMSLDNLLRCIKALPAKRG